MVHRCIAPPLLAAEFPLTVAFVTAMVEFRHAEIAPDCWVEKSKDDADERRTKKVSDRFAT